MDEYHPYTSPNRDPFCWAPDLQAKKSGGKKVSRRVRLEIYSEQHGLCHYCGCRMIFTIKPEPTMFTIDHVVPLSRGGSNQRSNLVGACKACNEAKGNT